MVSRTCPSPSTATYRMPYLTFCTTLSRQIWKQDDQYLNQHTLNSISSGTPSPPPPTTPIHLPTRTGSGTPSPPPPPPPPTCQQELARQRSSQTATYTILVPPAESQPPRKSCSAPVPQEEESFSLSEILMDMGPQQLPLRSQKPQRQPLSLTGIHSRRLRLCALQCAT